MKEINESEHFWLATCVRGDESEEFVAVFVVVVFFFQVKCNHT